MGQDLRPVQTVEAVEQCEHVSFYFRIIFKELFLVTAAQRFIKTDPLPDIERMIDMELRIMELFHKRHTFRHIIPVARIAVARALIIFRNLVTSLPVHVYNMFGDPGSFYGIVDSLFLFPVDQELGARTRNPADIGLIMDLEQERLVGHTRFQALDPCNLGFRNMKDLGDQFHRDIVGMILVALIEKAELLKVLKLVHLVVRLFVDIHFRHREVMLARKMAVDLAV